MLARLEPGPTVCEVDVQSATMTPTLKPENINFPWALDLLSVNNWT